MGSSLTLSTARSLPSSLQFLAVRSLAHKLPGSTLLSLLLPPGIRNFIRNNYWFFIDHSSIPTPFYAPVTPSISTSTGGLRTLAADQLEKKGGEEETETEDEDCFLSYLRFSWLDGYSWFQDTLLDADVAINAMMWQNGGFSGLDQWNFVMHPVNAAMTCDPRGDFVRQWVPELSGLSEKFIHQPWKCSTQALKKNGVELGVNYPHRCIEDLEVERRRACRRWWRCAGSTGLGSSTKSTDATSFQFPSNSLSRRMRWPEAEHLWCRSSQERNSSLRLLVQNLKIIRTIQC